MTRYDPRVGTCHDVGYSSQRELSTGVLAAFPYSGSGFWSFCFGILGSCPYPRSSWPEDQQAQSRWAWATDSGRSPWVRCTTTTTIFSSTPTFDIQDQTLVSLFTPTTIVGYFLIYFFVFLAWLHAMPVSIFFSFFSLCPWTWPGV